MASELHGRQDKIMRGPMWSGCDSLDVGDPLKARVNIACVSANTVNKRIAEASDFSTQPEIQAAAIKTIQETSKRVWLKLDACDIKVALQESERKEWNGDVDLGDGQVQALRVEYDGRCKQLQGVLSSRNETEFKLHLTAVSEALEKDIPFLQAGLSNAIQVYQKLMKQPNVQHSKLMEKCWDVADHNILFQQAVAFKSVVADALKASFALAVQLLRKENTTLMSYTRNVFKKKRSAATHVLVLLASDEERRSKPYVLPVQFIPYHSIKDTFIRDITSKVKTELANVGVTVVGTVTDGEFCSLRSHGQTRPLHLWQLVHETKESVRHMSATVLESMLRVTAVTSDGYPVVARPNDAIPKDLLLSIHEYMSSPSATWPECVDHFRNKLVPPGYTPHPFRRNTPESHLDKLRSLVATYMYRHLIAEHQKDGVDFATYMYIPEQDNVTGTTHHERADHGHLLKRIAGHTRRMLYPALDPEHFTDAMRDRTTGLTYAALMGLRKQSVKDAEALLSHHVANFMARHGHTVEAEYVKVIADWHEATDGRGLSQLQRCRKNYAMLSYIATDLMPWFNEMPDFSKLDINRPMDDIRGFSRETFIELSTNIESQEHRRRENTSLGFTEHPRASTTDDNEMFFSLCHRYLGANFTLRDFKYRWQKLVNEFCKKMQESLPFHYWTLNERFTEEEDHFDAPVQVEDVESSNHPLRLHRLTLNRREDASIFSAGRAYLPVRNRPTIRQQLHRFEVDLPPVPEELMPGQQ